jgi:hypothetical protein
MVLHDDMHHQQHDAQQTMLALLAVMHKGGADISFHQPPIGCLYKKQLDLFFPFASISLKGNLNAIAIGRFLRPYSIVDENENIILLFMEQKDMINRDQRSAELRR